MTGLVPGGVSQPGKGGRPLPAWVLMIPAALMAALVVWLVARAFPGAAHDGQIAGNQSMAVAGSLGLFGLVLAGLGRGLESPAGLRPYAEPVRVAARLTLAASVGYLALGALPGNARWAEPWWRYGGYAASLGAAWLVEWLLADPDDGLGGIVGRGALLVGFGALAFEVGLLLQPAFTLPPGALLTLPMYDWQESTRAFWTAGCWGLYGLAATAAGARLRSPATRLLTAVLLGFTLLYTLVFGLLNLTAAPWLRAGGTVAVVGGALGAAGAGLRSQGDRYRGEVWVLRALTLAAALVGAGWVALEVAGR